MAKKGPLYPHIPKSQRGVGIVVTTLFWSINEEEQAVTDYTERAAGARQSGDEKTARLFEHIATEEETHAKEFKERMHTLMKATPFAYRVWFDDGSATLIDALGETQARCIVEAGIATGQYHGKIDRIEKL